MIPPSPAFLIAAANAFVGPGDRGDANGSTTEFVPREVKFRSGVPWCVAFVHHVGYWSHYDERSRSSSWPLPPSAGCAELADFARTHGLLETNPRSGDVFLLWSHPLKRFTHTGIVIAVTALKRTLAGTRSVTCATIEGNPNDHESSRNGPYTMRHSRRLVPPSGDRFVRWADLDIREPRWNSARAAAARIAARTAA